MGTDVFPSSSNSVPASQRQLLETLFEHDKGKDKYIGVELEAQECSTCGDVGIVEKLFRCTNCQFRLQHTYCSNSYPKKKSFSSICNWCLRQHRKMGSMKLEARICMNAVRTESAEPHVWSNDFEMLLEAAALTEGTGQQSKISSISSSSHWGRKEISLSEDRMPRAAGAKMKREIKGEDSGVIKCKHAKKTDSSMFSKRRGRRYKCIVDVY